MLYIRVFTYLLVFSNSPSKRISLYFGITTSKQVFVRFFLGGGWTFRLSLYICKMEVNCLLHRVVVKIKGDK